MRITFRDIDNKDYWNNRWSKIEVDEPMFNENMYPLKYTLEAISLQNKNQKILEAGCGNGRILRYLYNKKFNVTGIDFIQIAIDKILKAEKKISVFQGNILQTNFNDGQFDTILAFGLYHNFKIDEVKKGLCETSRILKKNGILCFSFRADNIQNLILDKIKSKNSNSKRRKFHKLNLKEHELKSIINYSNLDIVRKYYVINMPLLFHFKIFRSNKQRCFNEHIGRRDGYQLNFIGNILNNFFTFFFRKNYCNIFLFICKKK